jgi:hypothetical protein
MPSAGAPKSEPPDDPPEPSKDPTKPPKHPPKPPEVRAKPSYHPNPERGSDVPVIFRPFVPPQYRPMSGPDAVDRLPGISDAAGDAARGIVDDFIKESGINGSGSIEVYANPEKGGGVNLLMFSGGADSVSGNVLPDAKGEGESGYSHEAEKSLGKSTTSDSHSHEHGESGEHATDGVPPPEAGLGIDASKDFSALTANIQFYQIGPHGEYAGRTIEAQIDHADLTAFAGLKAGKESAKMGVEFGLGAAVGRIEFRDITATAPIPLLGNWRITASFDREVDVGGLGVGGGAGVFREGKRTTVGVSGKAYAGPFGGGAGFGIGGEPPPPPPPSNTDAPRLSGILRAAKLTYDAANAIAKRALDAVVRVISHPATKETAPVPQTHHRWPKLQRPKETKKRPPSVFPPPPEPPHPDGAVVGDDPPPDGAGGSTSGAGPPPPSGPPPAVPVGGVSFDAAVTERSFKPPNVAERLALDETKRRILKQAEEQRK